MNKICLSQNNFDKLLELALNNCQVPNTKQNVQSNKIFKPISFFGYEPDHNILRCEDGIVSGYSYIDKNQVCKNCPPYYSKDDNDYDIIKQNCAISRYKVAMDYAKKDDF